MNQANILEINKVAYFFLFNCVCVCVAWSRIFEGISLAFSKLPDTVTLVLILGFIASQVMGRWWGLYSTIPGTGKIITSAMFYVKKCIDVKEVSNSCLSEAFDAEFIVQFTLN